MENLLKRFWSDRELNEYWLLSKDELSLLGIATLI